MKNSLERLIVPQNGEGSPRFKSRGIGTKPKVPLNTTKEIKGSILACRANWPTGTRTRSGKTLIPPCRVEAHRRGLRHFPILEHGDQSRADFARCPSLSDTAPRGGVAR